MFWLEYPTLFWVIAAIVLALIEAGTMGLTVIWFAIGALGAAIVSLFGFSFYAQVSVLIIISILTLCFTRPFVAKHLQLKRTPTNSDRCIGQKGFVICEIDNEKGVGQVKVGGLVWTSKSSTGEVLPIDTQVEVVAIEGVKAIVKPV